MSVLHERLFATLDVVNTDGATTELCALAGAIEAFCSRAVDATVAVDLTVELQVKRTLINMLEVDFARDAARFAAQYDEEVGINPSPVSWMREHCHMTSHAAATAVSVGERAERLQMSSEAVSDGRTGFAHLGLMAALAEALDEAGSPARFDERRLLAHAEALNVQPFRTLCSHVRHEADREAFLRQQLAERDWRTLELRPCGDGVALTGFLDAEGGALLRAALDPLAARTDREDLRSREQRYADALVEVASHALDNGTVATRAGSRPHLQVTTSLETLLGLRGAGAGELETGVAISDVTVQRFACDATMTRVVLDSASQVIDVGRSQRVAHGATNRALRARDRGCRWRGCDRTVSWTSAHHVVHWVHAGRTDMDNLALLCRHHHWLVHEGRWQIVRGEDGELYTIPPLGGSRSPMRSVGAPLPRMPAVASSVSPTGARAGGDAHAARTGRPRAPAR